MAPQGYGPGVRRLLGPALLLSALHTGCLPLDGVSVGDERAATLVEPDDWDGTSALPLIVSLHGYGSTGARFTRWVGLDSPEGAFVVAPDGLRDSNGLQYWNATPDCCDFDDIGPDDVGYLLDLVGLVRERWPVDPDRIVLIGHSNGGFMSYALACEAEHPFAALVSIAGSGAWDAEACAATRPVSVLQVHGTEDRAQAIEGDPTGPSAFEMLDRWGERGGCELDLAVVGSRDYTPVQDGDETSVEALSGCDDGVAVELWRMVGANHNPSFNDAFQGDVLEWMLGRRRVE